MTKTFLALLAFSAAAFADISYTGAFQADDDKFLTDFTLVSAMQITIRTWSFAGGTNAAGDVIAPGGFAPVLSLFDSAGNLLLLDSGGVAPGGCGPRSIDAATGFCLDAYINAFLSAGAYTTVLTQWDNTPNGPTLADGFLEDGNGNFTGGPFLLNAGAGFQRTGNWALDVPGTAITGVPEPQYAAFLAVLFLMILVIRSRHAMGGKR
jgi:hypothetical protein